MPLNIYRIDGWPVAPAVARDYLLMKADHDRVFPSEPLAVTSGYRTRSEQAAIFTYRYRRGAFSPWGDYRTYQGATWGRVSGLGPVASPDIGSNHTRGYALDVNLPPAGSARHDWFLANGRKYGFNWDEGRSVRESWHIVWRVSIFPTRESPDPWEGRGRPDPVLSSDPGMTYAELMGGSSGSGSGGSATPDTKINPLEIDMTMIYQPTDGPWKGRHYAMAPGFLKHIPTKESVQLFLDAHHSLGLKEILVSDKTFRVLLGVNGIDSKVLDANGYVFDYRAGERFTKGGSYVRGDDEAAKRLYRIQNKVGA